MKKPEESKQRETGITSSDVVLEAMLDGVSLEDMNGNFLRCNIAMAKMFGYTNKEELIGINITEVIPEREIPRVMEGFKKCLETGVTVNFEFIAKDKSGREFPIMINAAVLKDEDGKHIGVVSVLRDITELRRLEKRESLIEELERINATLTEKTEKLSDSRTAIIHMLKRVDKTGKELAAAKGYTDNIIKSMIDTLIVVDPDTNIKTVNKATSDLLGYKEEEIIGKPVATIFAEEEEEEEVTPFKGTRMKKLLAEGSIRDYDMTYKTKSGERIPVSFSGSVMRDRDGRLIGIVGIARDIREIRRLMEKEKELAAVAAAAETDRKRAAELDKAYKELKDTQAKLVETEKMAALGELGAGTAHELNNPLAGIIGFTEMVLDDLKNNIIKPEDTIHDLEIVLQDSYRCKNIVTNLLTYARGKDPEMTENDINSLIDQAIPLVERQNKLQDIVVIKEYGKDLPRVNVDKNQIVQVFVNIISNAQKAMPDGGELRIRSWLEDNYIAIEFKDTGMGISEENLSKVFDPFFTTYRPGKGTGLGLSVCYGIVKRHRGDIEVMSEKGKGASFIVKLPV